VAPSVAPKADPRPGTGSGFQEHSWLTAFRCCYLDFQHRRLLRHSRSSRAYPARRANALPSICRSQPNLRRLEHRHLATAVLEAVIGALLCSPQAFGRARHAGWNAGPADQHVPVDGADLSANGHANGRSSGLTITSSSTRCRTSIPSWQSLSRSRSASSSINSTGGAPSC
jgi:hypothetical protein